MAELSFHQCGAGKALEAVGTPGSKDVTPQLHHNLNHLFIQPCSLYHITTLTHSHHNLHGNSAITETKQHANTTKNRTEKSKVSNNQYLEQKQQKQHAASQPKQTAPPNQKKH